MAEPHEAASSLQPPGARHAASGAGSSGSASVDRSRHSMSSAGGGSMASGTTHVEANGPGFNSNLPFLELSNAASSSYANSRLSSISPTPQTRRDRDLSGTARAGHRSSHRHNRSGGAFLLNDALSSARPSQDASHGKQVQQGARSSARERHRSDRSDRSSRRGGATLAPSVTPEKRGRVSSAEPAPEAQHLRNASDSSAGAVSPIPADTAVLPAATAILPSPPSSAGSDSPAAPNQAMDLDSAQIVNMALNLSESRRLASRRNVSQQLPPRLAPLPDSAVGGSLLRQLQQQRRISRTISPRPDRGPGGRAVSGQLQVASPSPRVSSSGGLQPPFDPMGDGGSGSYRYHFSQSTLARAQKAKDYLELLAQQRRLLEFIPPLTPESSTQVRSTSLTSPPTASSNSSYPFLGTGSGSGDLVGNSARLGRPYNPLQYIRNRKARVRERKIIDGEALGFGDVAKAAEWVDEVAKWAATGKSRIPGGPTLPSFATADALTAALHGSPPPGSRSAGQGVTTKPKRPRLDWAIDPVDMLADVYWLEQGDNKMLVEDHHWRRVFPQDPKLYRPLSQRVGDGISLDRTGDPSFYPPTSFLDPATGHVLRTLDHAVADNGYGSTRKRGARQKLNELRSFHQRHSSSFQSQDNPRLRRDSLTGTSDSDSDRGLFGRRARDRFSTQSTTGTPNMALLRKAAAESRERDGSSNGSPALSGDHKNQKAQASVGSSPASQSTPAKGEVPSRNPTTPFTTGAVDGSVRSSRASLDIPAVSKRRSLDYDSSLPTSPELRPLSNEGIGLVPVLGGDLSPPPSRAASPPPSRFSKVKHMFRDHSHERGRERTNSSGFDRGSQERDDLTNAAYNYNLSQSLPQHEAAEAQSAPVTASASVAGDINKILDSKDPQSPMRKALSRANTATFDSHKSHGSITSIASLRHSGHVPSYGSGSQSQNQNQNQHRSEESGVSTASASSTLRGLFKGGPRIDTMLRSSVSKVSDILWRRDGSDAPYDGAAGAGDVSSSSSDDDSDAELTFRGRLRKTPRHSRSPSMNADWSEKSTLFKSKPGEKHYLDVMPTFGSRDHRGGHHHLAPSPDPVSRPPSRRSTRFERLKPPRIDVQDAISPNSDTTHFRPDIPRRETGGSSSLLPAGNQRGQRTTQDSDISESNTSRARRVDGDVLVSVEEPTDTSSVTVNPLPNQNPNQNQQLTVPSSNDNDGFANADRLRWSISQPTYRNQGDSLSRRELARLRASMYSSAVLARELSRRARQPHIMGDAATVDSGEGCVRRKVVASRGGALLTWPDIAAYSTNPAELVQRPIRHVELYPLAAQVLGGAIQRSGQSWQTSTEQFKNSTVPALRRRVDGLHERVAVELSGLARAAADEADTVSQNLVAVQRLQVIGVEHKIEQMMRRRRRRFRWVRRAGWLTVEWLLVGIMWMAWLVVMMLRVVMGTYGAVVAGARWLLWL